MDQLRTAFFLHAFSVFFLGILTTSNSSGQDSTKCDPKYFKDILLNNLAGEWDLTGQVGKRNVENHFSAEWTLNHQFIQLHFTDIATPPAYIATVFIGYDCVSERYVVHWLDSFGGRYSETLGYGTLSGQTITFRFEYPDSPFLNTFSYDDKHDSWHFHMTSKNDKGDWVIFADEFLTRKR